MEGNIDFSKYDDKCYLSLNKHEFTIYHLMMEKDWWNNTPYQPMLLMYSCNVFGECTSRQKRVAVKEDLPEYNSNIKEISIEKFNELRGQIEKFYMKETLLKSDKLHLYFQCEKLW